MTTAWHLLAIDPSVRSPGAALFRVEDRQSERYAIMQSSTLLDTARVRVLSEPMQTITGRPTWESDAERWLYVAGEILDWACLNADRLPRPFSLRLGAVVFEKPRIYREQKSRGDHNQLIPLAAIGTAVAAVVIARGGAGCRVMSPEPAEWSGQLPKATTGDPWRSPRGRRIDSRLRDEERAVVPAQHDAIDAVGIGLWALGRLAPRRAWKSDPLR